MKTMTKIVEFVVSDNTRSLMMRGIHTASEIIDEAIKSYEIDEEDREEWEKYDEIKVLYYKVVPREGYSKYYYESNKNVRGAFLAIILTIFC